VDGHLLLLVDLLEPFRRSEAEDMLAPGDLLPGAEDAADPEGEERESEERPPRFPQSPGAGEGENRGGGEPDKLRPLEDRVFVGKKAEERFLGSCEHDSDGSGERQEEERLRKRWRDAPAV
jgi:hypothetical protein